MIVGFFVGTLTGYYLNKNWTFRSLGNTKRIYRYFILYTFSLGIGLASITIQVELFEIVPEIANIFTIAITATINFIGSKFWVFENDK